MPTLLLVVVLDIMLDEEEVSELQFFVFFRDVTLCHIDVACDIIAFLQVTIGNGSFNRIFKPAERQSRTVDGQKTEAF